MTQRLTDEELVDLMQDARRACPIGSVHRHRASGATYGVILVALRESDLEPLVIYMKIGTATPFARPFEEFRDQFEFVREGME